MLGAIVGDVVGSRFEWDNLKSKEFELFKPPCHATDDSVMTIAIGNALLKAATAPPEKLAQTTVMSMRILGRAYHGPNYDYGGMFYHGSMKKTQTIQQFWERCGHACQRLCLRRRQLRRSP